MLHRESTKPKTVFRVVLRTCASLLPMWYYTEKAVCATLETDASGPASQLRAAALSDMARLRSCAGALASAWLTARPGLAELTAV